MRARMTEDERAIRDIFAGFFDNECPISVVKAAQSVGYDTDLWQKLCSTGAPGTAQPASAGGGDANLRDLAIVVEQ